MPIRGGKSGIYGGMNKTRNKLESHMKIVSSFFSILLFPFLLLIENKWKRTFLNVVMVISYKSIARGLGYFVTLASSK